MKTSPFRLIWAKEPAEFSSAFNVSESVNRMIKVTERRVPRSVDPTIHRSRTMVFLGSVSKDKVRIHPYPQWPPSGSDGLATPWFQGKFIASGDKSILRGDYSTYRTDKIIVTAFFSVLSILVLGAVGSIIRYGLTTRTLGLFLGSTVFFVGAAMAFGAQQAANRAPQIAILSQAIRNVLSQEK